MSRSLPTPPLSSLPFTSIQSLASYPEPLTAFTPKAWFDRARHEADLAIIAERKNKKEEMFIAYTKACQCYANAKLHPDSADVRKSDPVWANRLKDFKEVCLPIVSLQAGGADDRPMMRIWQRRRI